MAIEDELREVLATFPTDRFPFEIVRISYSLFPETIYLTSQMNDGATILDENDVERTVIYAPMELSEENEDGLLKNERTLSFQGINDVISYYEDFYDVDSDEKIVVDVLGYLSDRDGVLSEVAIGPYTYYVSSTKYSQEYNACTITINTNSTNISKTGRVFNKNIFPMLAGFDK